MRTCEEGSGEKVPVANEPASEGQPQEGARDRRQGSQKTGDAQSSQTEAPKPRTTERKQDLDPPPSSFFQKYFAMGVGVHKA